MYPKEFATQMIKSYEAEVKPLIQDGQYQIAHFELENWLFAIRELVICNKR